MWSIDLPFGRILDVDNNQKKKHMLTLKALNAKTLLATLNRLNTQTRQNAMLTSHDWAFVMRKYLMSHKSIIAVAFHWLVFFKQLSMFSVMVLCFTLAFFLINASSINTPVTISKVAGLSLCF